MNIGGSGQRLLLLVTIIVAAASVQAQELPWRTSISPASPARALAPVTPRVTPQYDEAGGYGLRLRVQYLENLTANLELRRHAWFHDDNLKTQHPRTSIAWHVRWYF